MPCETPFSIGDMVRVVDVFEKGVKDWGGGCREVGKDRCIGMVGTLESVKFDKDGIRFWVEFDDVERKKHEMYCSGVNASKIEPVSPAGATPIKDIFGGTLDDARQYQNGHNWVALDTPHEHCMTCRRGPTKEPCKGVPVCKCGHHLDEHQLNDLPGPCKSPYPNNSSEIPQDGKDMMTRRCTCTEFEYAPGKKEGA